MQQGHLGVAGTLVGTAGIAERRGLFLPTCGSRRAGELLRHQRTENVSGPVSSAAARRLGEGQGRNAAAFASPCQMTFACPW